MSLLGMIFAHWQQSYNYATVSISLTRPREYEPVTDDI